MFAHIKRQRFWVSLIAAVLIPCAATLLHATLNNTGDFELGQVDFNHSTVNFVRGKGLDFSGLKPPGMNSGIAVDSVNGCVYLADTANNRVLGWRNETSFANGATADIVIGQKDQWSKAANFGGTVTNSTLSSPVGVAVDPLGNLYISDNGNGRVVEYDLPCNIPGPYPVAGISGNLTIDVADPWGLATDSAGDLFVADHNENRVVECSSPTTTGSCQPGDPIFFSAVFGQSTSSGITCNQGAPPGAPQINTLCLPYGVGTDGNNVYIADSGNYRVLEFTASSPGAFGTDPSAALVLGQNKFTSAIPGCNPNTSASSLCQPHSVAVDPNHNVYVADTGNNRVVEYNDPPRSGMIHGQAASMIIGQTSATGNLANMGTTIASNTLSSPAGVITDALGNLFVLDDGNVRALEYTEGANPPTNTVANLELGQFDFVHSTTDFVDASSLSNPSAVAVDRLPTQQHLYVVDADNNRVLGYNDATAFTNGMPADLVLGQPDFYTNTCISPPGGVNPPSASSLCLDEGVTGFAFGGGVAVDSLDNVWVSDLGNSRVLEFPSPFAYMTSSGQSAGEPASLVLGQADLTTGTAPSQCSSASATTFCAPAGLGFDGADNLYVADFGANRVLEYSTPASAGGPAPQAAHIVLGQGSAGNSFSGSSCNLGVPASPSADTLCGPMGVAVDKHKNVYVADYNNNRLLEYDNPLGPPGTPGTPGAAGDVTADLVFGQDMVGAAFTSAVCNNGGISATSLCQPSGVAIDLFNSVFIADQFNNRVLAYSQNAFPPTNVIAALEFGQGAMAFKSGMANLGGLTANSLNLARTPGGGQQDGVAADSIGDLYAVDAGNVRVISYAGPFFRLATPTPTPSPTPTPTVLPTPTVTPTPTPSPVGSPIPGTTITATPKQLKFGKVEATGAGKTKKVTLNNEGAVAAQFGQLGTSSSFSLSNDTCSNTTRQPEEKCTVDVTFNPPTVSAVSETLSIPYNGPVPSVTLEGTGTAVSLHAPKSKTLPAALAGAVGKAVVIAIANKSKVTVEIGVPLPLTNTLISSDLCANQSLAPKTSCSVTVEFAPGTGAIGKLTDYLSYPFTYGAAPPGRVSVTLHGKVTKPKPAPKRADSAR